MNGKSQTICIITLLIMVVGPLGGFFARAADLYVTANTSAPAGNGSAQSPYNSIHTALVAAQAGDTVRLLSGIYYTPISFPHGGDPGNPITLVANDGPRTAVIDCQNSGNVNGVNIVYGNIVVDGLEVRNVFYSGIKVDGDFRGTQGPRSYGNYGMYYSRNRHANGADNVVLQNCYVHHIGYDGLKIGHVNNIRILNNEIFKTGTGGNQGGLDMVGVYDSLISGNYVHDDGDPSSMDVGMFAKGGSENIIFENNLVENIASPFAGIAVGGDTEWHNTRYTPSNFDFDINQAILQRDQDYESNLIDNESSYVPEYMAESRNVIVRGNIIVKADPPLSFRNAYNPQVYNNTIVNSGWSQGWVKLWCDGVHDHPNQDIGLHNNVFVNTSVTLRSSGVLNDKHVGTIFPLNTVGMTASNNLFWSMGAPPPLGNPVINPELQVFADPQLDENFHHAADSPPCNAGNDLIASGVVNEPFENRFGVLVPQGRFDIGAYEVVEGVVPGDINNDLTVNLEDPITALQVSAGSTHSVNLDADVNGDGVIGVEDAIVILQIIAD